MLDGIAAPHTDQQEHGSQFHFPEEEEEEEVQRHKDAHDTSFQEKQQRHIIFDSLLLPPTNDREHCQQCVEYHHRQAQAVNTQVVINFNVD